MGEKLNINAFERVKADKWHLAKRGMVHGVGVNDSPYKTRHNGIQCPIYNTWKNILFRCYSPRGQAIHPTYIGCSVVSEWLYFNAFRMWMDAQDWRGKTIDKDILVQGNKVYGPENCIFVTGAINSLINGNAAVRGAYPVGVYFSKDSSKYKAQCNVNGKRVHIGFYGTSEAASAAYTAFKFEVIHDVAIKQAEPLRSALLRWKL